MNSSESNFLCLRHNKSNSEASNLLLIRMYQQTWFGHRVIWRSIQEKPSSWYNWRIQTSHHFHFSDYELFWSRNFCITFQHFKSIFLSKSNFSYWFTTSKSFWVQLISLSLLVTLISSKKLHESLLRTYNKIRKLQSNTCV